jgi:mono/diheme cytochrome c family protein
MNLNRAIASGPLSLLPVRSWLPAAWLLASTLAAPAAELAFEKDIRPILKTHCFHCHGEEEKPEGGVDLRLRRFMDKELDGGAHVLVAGQPGASEMVRLIREGDMPKKGKKVSSEDLALIERWILEGAKTARTEPESLAPGPVITDEDRGVWSFKPIVKPPLPEVPNPDRVRTPVDAFVLAQLRANGFDFAPDAGKRTLLRRVTLNLTGLPPTPDEVDAFLADQSPDAYEKVVERLLATPAYGERWARHWLDVAGYADSNGFAEADSLRPQAWRYRDYVIRSLIADKPWNEFIVEQLAGDELAAATHAETQEAVLDEKRREALIATAFLRLAPDGTGDDVPDVKLARNQVIAEEIKVVTSSLLGLTVGCAQCHDHRYDPITQADYYRLRAVFEPAYDWQKWRAPAQRLISLYTPEERAKATEIEKQAQGIDAEAQAMSKQFLDQIFEKEIVKLPEPEREPYRAARAKAEKERTPEERTLIKKYPSALALYSLDLYDPALQKKVTEKAAEATKLRGTKPAEGLIMALTEVKGELPVTHLFHRGDHDQPKQRLTPGELTVLAAPAIEPFTPAGVPSGSSGRRLAYARWLTSGQHPLVARVLVNRFWLNHFGRGFVNTPGDFGLQGERPTHPELLDWLASEFMAGGWKLKPLHRLMVLSTTYRQSSRSDASREADPENKLYARFKLQRLSAEALRDSMLAAAGTLNRTPFGPPINIARDPGGRIVVGQEQLNANGDVVGVSSLGDNDFRRSIYVQVRRKTPLTVLETFDAPIMVPNCESRNSTTVAPQSLLLMNDTFVLETSKALALRLRKELPGEARGQIVRAWRLLFGQDPHESDVQRSLSYLSEQTEAVRVYHQGLERPKDTPPPDPPLEALSSLCQILLSSNRFLYIE